MCTHHAWRWLIVIEPPPNQNELVQPILNDPNVFIPQAEVKLLAEMFAVTELVWTAELGIKSTNPVCKWYINMMSTNSTK